MTPSETCEGCGSAEYVTPCRICGVVLCEDCEHDVWTYPDSNQPTKEVCEATFDDDTNTKPRRQARANYIEKITRWLMPDRQDPELAAEARASTMLDGVYKGDSRRITRLVRLAYYRGIRRGASSAWEAAQPIVLRDLEPSPMADLYTKVAAELDRIAKPEAAQWRQLCSRLDPDHPAVLGYLLHLVQRMWKHGPNRDVAIERVRSDYSLAVRIWDAHHEAWVYDPAVHGGWLQGKSTKHPADRSALDRATYPEALVAALLNSSHLDAQPSWYPIMSDDVRCDVCGLTGSRRLSRAAPNGWMFSEVKHESTAEVFIVYACSPACARKFWQRGPGSLHENRSSRSTSDVFTFECRPRSVRLEVNRAGHDLVYFELTSQQLADPWIEYDLQRLFAELPAATVITMTGGSTYTISASRRDFGLPPYVGRILADARKLLGAP